MADLLPSTPDLSTAEEAEPRVIGVDSDDADDLISALSAGTARELLSALHDEPANPAALADRVDTSLQNAQYHLSNLEDAGVVEVVDTVYSEKGREMNVYAPSDRPLVVYAGKEEEASGLRTALSRLLGSLGILALASVVVEQLFGDRGVGAYFTPGGDGAGAPDGGDGGDDGAFVGGNATETPDVVPEDATEAATPTQDAATTPTPEPSGTATPVATETPAATGEPTTAPPTEAPAADTLTPTAEPIDVTQQAEPGVVDAAGGLPPGLLFFAGGATVLAIVFLWYYRRELLAAVRAARSGS